MGMFDSVKKLAPAVFPTLAIANGQGSKVPIVGDLFGGGNQTDPNAAGAAAQAAFIQRMMGREGTLYPELQKILKSLPGSTDQTYSDATSEMKRLYPGIQDQITNFTLPQAALDNLTKLRDERINSINNDANTLIGSRVSDLAKRGVISSTTAEGSMGEVGKAMAPAISAANQDYYNSALTLPRQTAMDTFNLASNYGGTLSAADRQKMQDLLAPYLDMWKTTAGISATPPQQVQKQPNQMLDTISKLGPTFASLLMAAPAAA